MTLSQPMQEAYAQATYYESVAPSLHLSKEEQQPLLDLQQAKFDSKEEMLNEASQMKEAMQSDTVQAMVESKARDNHEYQEQAQRTIEEQAISPEIEMEAGDMVE